MKDGLRWQQGIQRKGARTQRRKEGRTRRNDTCVSSAPRQVAAGRACAQVIGDANAVDAVILQMRLGG